MFHLFDFFMDALKNGMVLFVDELDAKLHPLLTRYIINLFHNSDTNKGNGQLIYSTHDTANLNKETFRRDEIWFAEKSEEGSTRVFSLEEFKDVARFDRKIDKAYLEGRFGAIANIDTNYED